MGSSNEPGRAAASGPRLVAVLLFFALVVGGALVYDRLARRPDAAGPAMSETPPPVPADESPAPEPEVEVEAELEPIPEPDPALAAYVTASALNVRAGPGGQAPVIGIVVKYDPVTVIDDALVEDDKWYEIDAAGGHLNGWVSGDYLRFGEPPPPVLFGKQYDYGKAETPTLVKGRFKYVGVSGCLPCHEKTTGYFPVSAYEVWKGHYHSEAYRSLFRDYTRNVAKNARGVDDPGTDWRCIKCHVTALGADPSQLAPTYTQEDGVGCEVCHGPGSEYAQKDHSPRNPDRYALGFYKLTNLKEREKLCVTCHNPLSPSFKPFNILAFSRAIQHWPDPGEKPKPTPGGGPVKAAASLDEFPAVPKPETLAAYFEKSEETAKEREEIVAVVVAEETKGLSEAELAERARQEELAAVEAERAAQAALEEARIAEEARLAEERRLEEELLAQAKLEAEQAEAARLAREAEEQARREAAEEAGEPPPEPEEAEPVEAGPLRYLDGLDPVLTLNPKGEKYLPVRFPHAAHASGKKVPGIECATCHHTLEGDEEPEACSSCHGIDGDAEETEIRTRATHAKEKGFPKAPGQDEVSCYGCHQLQKAMMGKNPPTKCIGCHKKKPPNVDWPGRPSFD